MKTYKEKGVGQGHGEPKIATLPSLFGISRNISLLRTISRELRCFCFDYTGTIATKYDAFSSSLSYTVLATSHFRQS